MRLAKSLLDAGNLDFCREILASAGDKILLPSDVVVSEREPV